jgi:TolQ protein
MPAPHDLSFAALFLQADPIVKGVMLILALASLGCWTIIIEKSLRLLRIGRQTRAFEQAVRDGIPLAQSGGAPQSIVAAGTAAWRDRDPEERRAERRARIERAMRGAMAAHLRRLEGGLPFLATVGSTAPFVGLFGTVWGIMHSFSAIAGSQDTSLAVVAPGIAEALFATAIGLVAAIPAVVAYNKFTTDLGRQGQRLGAVIAVLGDRLSRDPGAVMRAEAAE